MVDGVVWLVVLLVLGQAWGNPVQYHEGEQRPLAASLSKRLASHAPALSDARSQEPRLPLPGLPSPQELEAIKKVAQILIMLGEQVIPSIIGDVPGPGHGAAGTNCNQTPLEDIPNDPIKNN